MESLEFNDSYDIALYTNNVVPYNFAALFLLTFRCGITSGKLCKKNIQQMLSLP